MPMDIIARAARLYGNAPALRMTDKTLSFNECNARAEGIASRLSSRGIGDIVAIVSPNTPELVMLLLGLLKAGIIAAPLNYRFPEHLLSNTIEKLRPRLIVTSGTISLRCSIGIAELLGSDSLGTAIHATTSIVPENNDDAAMPDLPSTVLDDTIGCIPGETAPFDRFRVKKNMEAMHQPVTIIHTSASSGEAKAAVHSFANHWYSALGSNDNIPFGAGNCWLLSLPLYHIGGYSLLFRSLISGGALAVGNPDESLGQSLRNFPLTHLSVVPTQLYRLLADQKSAALLRAMNAVLLGGSSAPKSLIEEAVRQHIPLYLSYGSTEMSSQIATSPSPIQGIQENSGKLLPWREIMASKDGELLVKGACLFQGYLREGKIEPQTDNDGWFHTSDIGTVTDDGTVTVAGRKDNMFISGGENIHPEEIEKMLMMIDGILDALVVPVDDVEYGQRPLAFIKTIEENKPDELTITRAMHSTVGKLKSPTRYYRVEEWATLPGSQKIDRKFYKKLSLLPPDA
ncbi:MAG: o-succinylbenzoate--CoA ligase [Chlorobium sp.]